MDLRTPEFVSIKEDLATIKSVLADQDEKLDKLVYTVEGNGQPGLKIRVDRLDQQAKTTRHWVRLIAGTIITGLIGLGLQGAVSCSKTNTSQTSSDSR